MVGLWGTGSIHDVDVDIQKAEEEIERKWAERGGGDMGEPSGSVELKGPGIGSGLRGKESAL
jgi:hypothetical protein